MKFIYSVSFPFNSTFTLCFKFSNTGHLLRLRGARHRHQRLPQDRRFRLRNVVCLGLGGKMQRRNDRYPSTHIRHIPVFPALELGPVFTVDEVL